jgi:hypothetical protein
LIIKYRPIQNIIDDSQDTLPLLTAMEEAVDEFANRETVLEREEEDVEDLSRYSYSFKFYRIMRWEYLVDRIGGIRQCKRMNAKLDDWLELIVRTTFNELEEKMASTDVYMRTICNTTARYFIIIQTSSLLEYLLISILAMNHVLCP